MRPIISKLEGELLMKHKKLVSLAIVFMFALSVFAVMTHLISATTGPILSIVPTGASGATSTTIISAQAVGASFSVDVRVDDYASVNIGGTNNGLSECSFTVTWDPTVLEYVSYTDGSWLPDQQNFGDLSGNVASGQLTIGQAAFDTSNSEVTADSATGSVTATITFQVLTTGSTALSLQPSGTGVPYLDAPETVGGLTSGHAVPDTNTVNAEYGTLPSPTPSPTPIPTASPIPSPTPNPTTSPTPSPTPIPTSSPTPTPSPGVDTVTFESSPEGAQIDFNGVTVTTPHTFDVQLDSLYYLNAVSPCTINGASDVFESWSTGIGQSGYQIFIFPSTTLTATYG